MRTDADVSARPSASWAIWRSSSQVMTLMSQPLYSGSTEVPKSAPTTGSKHLVQTQRVYLIHKSPKLFVFNEVWCRRDVLNVDCSRICSCESLAFQQPSTPTPRNFPMLNLKDFREEYRVEHMLPNQEGRNQIYLLLSYLSGCSNPLILAQSRQSDMKLGLARQWP